MPWSRVNTKYSIHWVLLTTRSAYTAYCIIPGSTVSGSQLVSSLSWWCCTQFSTFPQLRVNQSMESQLSSRLPPELPPENGPPPGPPPISHDHGLQVHLPSRLITAYKCLSELTRSQSPSASPNSLHPGLQVHLWVHSISVSKRIFKHTRSWPPSTSSRSDGGCLEIPG